MAEPTARQPDPRDDDTEAPGGLEIDAASEDEALEIEQQARAAEEIIGDTDGDDYRAGTVDPESADRGPWSELSGERLDGDPGSRRSWNDPLP